MIAVIARTIMMMTEMIFVAVMMNTTIPGVIGAHAILSTMYALVAARGVASVN